MDGSLKKYAVSRSPPLPGLCGPDFARAPAIEFMNHPGGPFRPAPPDYN